MFENTRLYDEAIEAAHRRLAVLQQERVSGDWDGREFGTPVGRPEQIPDDSKPWRTWLYLGGRGTGKTRAAAERVRRWVKEGRRRIGIIAPTAADARDTMIEGESGLLNVCRDSDHTDDGEYLGKPRYEVSKRRVTWGNGAMVTAFSAEEPQRLRGPQHEGIWADEICAWQYMRETWDMAQFGLRLGNNPQMIVSTTPKPLRLLHEMVADPSTIVTRGSTFDNEANLSSHFIDRVREKYEGTSLGLQELYAQILEEAEGALWKRAWIEDGRCDAYPDLARVCVSIDPAVTANEETSDECGIIVCGVTGDGQRGFVIDDLSGILTPLAWARKALDAYDKYDADFILAEVNNGGDLVIQNIKTADSTRAVNIHTVHARKGKYLRAEPVSALYEQGRISHAGNFEVLEDQLVSWEPLGKLDSPDRLDALVHGFTALMVKAKPLSADLVAAPLGSKDEPAADRLER